MLDNETQLIPIYTMVKVRSDFLCIFFLFVGFNLVKYLKVLLHLYLNYLGKNGFQRDEFSNNIVNLSLSQ